MSRRLTLVAGSGTLVPIVAGAVRARGDDLQVIDVADRSDLGDRAVHPVPLSDFDRMLELIHGFRTTHLVLAGAVRLSDSDRERLAKRMGFAGLFIRPLGDTGLALMGLLYAARNGVKLVGADQIVPELLAPEGLIAGPAPGAAIAPHLRASILAARAVGRLDLGQAVVLAGRRPIAAEDVDGTDALIARVAALRDKGLAGNGRYPLILAKALKPRQPRFVDLPTIGPETVRSASTAGIEAIAVEAGRTLVLDRQAVEGTANEARVSVIGLKVRRG